MKGSSASEECETTFASRFAIACDLNSECPPKHGRMTWIRKEMRRRFDLEVPVETVSKWLHGKTEPRPDKCIKLAELLEVDLAWLRLGVGLPKSESVTHVGNPGRRGAVDVVAGLILMDGGEVARPDASHLRMDIHLHAIIQGHKYDFYVTLADEKNRFRLPTQLDHLTAIGVIRGSGQISVHHIAPRVIREYGRLVGGVIDIAARAVNHSCIESFADLPRPCTPTV